MTERSLLATYPTQTIRLGGKKKKKVTTGRAAEVTAVQAETGMRLMVSSKPPPPPRARLPGRPNASWAESFAFTFSVAEFRKQTFYFVDSRNRLRAQRGCAMLR